ncbi:hypothetical protein E1263_03930 [Kribbella antibiotica]|uniref:WD40 repeat domain-containing protein n=1 Tax=Kribbella antibiotica TaxID=190195 RepID=A0A4R4ZVR5_9ACTN|nr:hypothetical protein [Kribbella antibiotica]TDD62314.1 hypothetical protein E1263_03930 [Kribbella antibiotica]
MAEKIPSWPKVTIRLYDDHNAEVKIAGRSHPVNHHDPRQAAIALVTERAAQLGRAMKATAVEADGTSWPLVIHPDGEVEAVATDTRKRGGSSGGGGSSDQKPIWPIIVAFVMAGILIFGTTLYLTVWRHRTDKPVVQTEPGKLPTLPEPSVGPDEFSDRPVPPGWSAKADWSVDIAANSEPAVSPDGTEVAVLTPDKKIAVFDSNGKVLWQDKVPTGAKSPVYTTIDSKTVLAVASEDILYYWPGGGTEAVEVELPNSSDVQFFGTSPLIELAGDAGASVVSGSELKAVPNQPRSSTVLLAQGTRALMSRYAGPLYWSEPGKDLQKLNLKAPGGGKTIDHVVAASPDFALAFWHSAKAGEVIPTVHSTTTGAVAATCRPAQENSTENWQWLPDPNRKIAAWGPCLINFSNGRTFVSPSFQPLSISGTTIYGTNGINLLAITPGGKPSTLAADTARPWGIAGGHAIIMHDSVVYALAKK